MGNLGTRVTALVVGLGLALALGLSSAPPSEARQGQTEIPAPASPEDITLDPRVVAIAKELRCPICQSLSVADSPTELATQMRSIIAEKLAAGESPEAIRAYFASKYGDWILLKPKREGFTWLVWLLPVAGLMAGGTLIFFFTRRSIRSAEEPSGEEPPEAEASGHYAERLAREMKELDA